MTIRQIERRKRQDTLSDALLSLAASLQDAAGSDDALNRLTSGLADRGIACALFVQGDQASDLLLQRATLPLAPDVWGRPLRLPRLVSSLNRLVPIKCPKKMLGQDNHDSKAISYFPYIFLCPLSGVQRTLKSRS